jgi:hypothetical protein
MDEKSNIIPKLNSTTAAVTSLIDLNIIQEGQSSYKSVTSVSEMVNGIVDVNRLQSPNAEIPILIVFGHNSN